MIREHDNVVRLDLPANYTYLNVLSGCIAELMSHIDQVDDHETLVYNLQLAAHEVCTNIIGHAYTDKVGARILVALTLIEQPRLIIDLLIVGSRSILQWCRCRHLTSRRFMAMVCSLFKASWTRLPTRRNVTVITGDL